MPLIWGFSALTYEHSPNIFFFHTLKHAYTYIHMITSEYQQEILMKVRTCKSFGWTLWGVTFSHRITRRHVKAQKLQECKKKKAGTGSKSRVCAGDKWCSSSKVYRDVTERRELLNSWTCRHPERASCQQQYQAVSCRNEQSPEIIWDHLSCSLLWTATAQQRPGWSVELTWKRWCQRNTGDRRGRRQRWQGEREEWMYSNSKEKKSENVWGVGGEEKMLKPSKQWKSGGKVKPGRPVRGGLLSGWEWSSTNPQKPPEDKQRSSSSLVSMLMNCTLPEPEPVWSFRAGALTSNLRYGKP